MSGGARVKTVARDSFGRRVGPLMKTMAYRRGEKAHVVREFLEAPGGVVARTLCGRTLPVRLKSPERARPLEAVVEGAGPGTWITLRCHRCERVVLATHPTSAMASLGPRPLSPAPEKGRLPV